MPCEGPIDFVELRTPCVRLRLRLRLRAFARACVRGWGLWVASYSLDERNFGLSPALLPP